MGSINVVGKPRWNVFDGFKVIPSAPEALMSEINSAISTLEYARANNFLNSSSSSPQSKNKNGDANSVSQYDARMADEAYKAGMASLAAGKLDEAITTLNVALSKCPPNKTSAVAKLQSLISLTSSQLQKSPAQVNWKKGSLPNPGEDGNSSSDDYDEDEQEVFVSAVRSKYMESKSRRKASYHFDSSSLTFSPTTERLFFSSKEMDQEKETDREEREDFYSADSRLSRCSSAISAEAFLSAKPTLSRCSSLGSFHFPDFRRQEIIWEFCQCEGWPFGLCRKSLLLPPLPKSPSESWLTRKSTIQIKLP